MAESSHDFVPGAGFHWLTPLYDPLVALTCRDRTVKTRLVSAANLQPDQRVLDLGCGTGTLSLRVKRACPGAEVSGVDADPRMLRAAVAKAKRAGLEVAFTRGFAESLPYPDGTFDRVVSSLFFHHLSPTQKACALREVARVLAPGGELHVADWGRPAGPLMRFLFLGIRLLDGWENTAAHSRGELPALIAANGFRDVRAGERFSTVFGTLDVLSGVKPVKASA
jgi:ubiquinone/menaquinone biosynthesis C-methylase UbiE